MQYVCFLKVRILELHVYTASDNKFKKKLEGVKVFVHMIFLETHHQRIYIWWFGSTYMVKNWIGGKYVTRNEVKTRSKGSNIRRAKGKGRMEQVGWMRPEPTFTHGSHACIYTTVPHLLACVDVNIFLQFRVSCPHVWKGYKNFVWSGLQNPYIN